MTVVAWDGRVLASDSRRLWEGFEIEQGAVKKVFTGREGEAYDAIGIAGDNAFTDAARRWIMAGHDEAAAPPDPDEESEGWRALAIKDGQAYFFAPGMTRLAVGAPFAIGSGEKYAMGAMLAGIDAFGAVDVASRACIACGGPVQFWESVP